jgi:glycerol-3-phosphate cytidylyltransferase
MNPDPILPEHLALPEAYHLLSLPAHTLKELKMLNKRVGFTCGAFDLLHPGHMLMLKEAKQQCDFLLVGLQTDPSGDRPDKNAPIETLQERRIRFESNRYIDAYGIYETESELEQFLRKYARKNGGFIDVRILDEEYKVKPYTGQHLPIEVFFNWRKHPYSTTSLRRRTAKASLHLVAAAA